MLFEFSSYTHIFRGCTWQLLDMLPVIRWYYQNFPDETHSQDVQFEENLQNIYIKKIKEKLFCIL